MGFLHKFSLGQFSRLLIYGYLFSGLFIMPAAIGQESDQPLQLDSSLLKTDSNYVYRAIGRNDPFKPFISPKAVSPTGPDPNEIVEEGGELTGMQLFEPGQLSLVGTMMTETEGIIALVEDQTKKGYILRRGMKIGKRGVVAEIDSEQVFITETARTRSGQEITNTVTMRLKKEGDK